MQQWEYCMLGPIMQGTRTKPLAGYYPRLVFFRLNGQIVKPLEDMGGTQQSDVVAMVIAQLGVEGWELVGAGTVGTKLAERATIQDAELHFLYFKRPRVATGSLRR